MKIQKRIDNPVSIDEFLIEQELTAGKQVTVQFSSTEYNAAMLAQLNSLCSKHDDNFVVRFYGHHGQSFDCNVLASIPNVKALSIDCLAKAHNVEAITNLMHLERFAIGVLELKETKLLSAANLHNVKGLFLLDTKTKAFNLEYLKSYKNLSSLIVCGHTKNIDVLGTINSLQTLRLNSISKAPLTFINALKNLNFLSIMLGGRENILEIIIIILNT
jgi:protein phosphatase 1 regulatory subunit 7